MTMQGRTVAGDAPSQEFDQFVALATFMCVCRYMHGACACMNIVVNSGRTVIDEPTPLKVTFAIAADAPIFELLPEWHTAERAIFFELTPRCHVIEIVKLDLGQRF